MLCLQKKININIKTSMSIYTTCEDVLNFSFKLKKLIAMFFSQINKVLISLLKLKTNSD